MHRNILLVVNSHDQEAPPGSGKALDQLKAAHSRSVSRDDRHLLNASKPFLLDSDTVTVGCVVECPVGALDYKMLTPELRRDVRHKAISKAQHELDQLAETVRQLGCRCFTQVYWQEDDEKIHLCKDQHDLLIISGSMYSQADAFCGSGCARLVVTGGSRSQSPQDGAHLLLYISCLDGSSESVQFQRQVDSLREAAVFAQHSDVRLQLVSILPDIGELTPQSSQLRKEVAAFHEANATALIEQAGIEGVEIRILEGKPLMAVSEYANQCLPDWVFLEPSLVGNGSGKMSAADIKKFISSAIASLYLPASS